MGLPRPTWLVLPEVLSWMLGPMGTGGFSGGAPLSGGITSAPMVSLSTHM